MEQVQTHAPQIRTLLDYSNQFYQDLLGYKPEQTSLQQIPENKWNEFTTQTGLNPNSSGIYLPRNQTAVIQEENPLSLFHEYFGHGLYCEQNLTGRKLVDLEKRLLEEEKQEFSNSGFTLEDLQRFRQQNKTFQELENFRQENLDKYELFAIWTEYLLSGEFGLTKDFQKRYDSFQKQDREIIDSVINFNNYYGDLATFYGFGMARIPRKKRLQDLSKDIFGEKTLEKTKLIMHFGSGKPFSDIDLFVISDEISPIYEGWLDVRAYGINDIEKNIKFLNPMVTDPLLVGKNLIGEKPYLDKLRKKIFEQEITEEAINFSLEEYEKEMKRAKDESLGEHLQKKNLRSAKTFLTNAIALSKGKKILTFSGLVEYSNTLSHSGEFRELKGGIE